MNARFARTSSGLKGRVLCLLVVFAVASPAHRSWSQSHQAVAIRGHQQTVYLYGSPRGEPVIVSSGDGGWIHLAPHVADVLSAHGFYVIGFDVKGYLSSFTTEQSTLRREDEPADYRVLTELATKTTGKKPMLIGVSEGAGLSVLAATDPATKAGISGVVGLGLPDLNELGWRWKDMMIYLTHRAPPEPLFSAAAIVDRVAPLPLAVIHSSQDEFVPVAEVERVVAAAHEPKQLWIVTASNHRFSDNLDEFDRRLLEAMAWVHARAPR
jgi:pimeloyl-ACP methyl ester carboxylesterase